MIASRGGSRLFVKGGFEFAFMHEHIAFLYCKGQSAMAIILNSRAEGGF